MPTSKPRNGNRPSPYEVVDLEPDTKFVMRTTQGPFPMETTYLWQDGPAGTTKMTLRNRDPGSVRPSAPAWTHMREPTSRPRQCRPRAAAPPAECACTGSGCAGVAY